MTTYHSTRDPRIRLACHGPDSWRTEVVDELGSSDWAITGPPYPSKAAAAGHVDDVLAGYFGELPTRAELAERIEGAVRAAQQYAGSEPVTAVRLMLAALLDGQVPR